MDQCCAILCHFPLHSFGLIIVFTCLFRPFWPFLSFPHNPLLCFSKEIGPLHTCTHFSGLPLKCSKNILCSCTSYFHKCSKIFACTHNTQQWDIAWTSAAGSAVCQNLYEKQEKRDCFSEIASIFIIPLNCCDVSVFALVNGRRRLVYATVSMLAIIITSCVVPDSSELSADFLTVYRCNSRVLA